MRICMYAVLIATAWFHPSAAGAQVLVVSSAVAEQHASAGETYAGMIRLRNTGGSPQEVRVYQTGYLFHADGRAQHMAPDSQPRSNAAWIRLPLANVVLLPGEDTDLRYTVTVPGAELAPGTYWSLVMVEPLAADAPELSATGAPAVGLRTVTRYAIQLATHVRGDAPHALAISNARVAAAAAGAREFSFELANSGVAGYRPHVFIELFDAAGGVVARHEAQRGLLYPGTSTVQRFTLPALGAGAYEAYIIVDTGAPTVFGAQIRLNLVTAR